jgi:hypothetical protein
MIDPTARALEKPPPGPSRLEGWLVKKLQGECLQALPRYYPLGGHDGRCPEQYARDLLAGLRSAQSDLARLEQLKDDGRAFRSWAEAAASHAMHRVASRNSVLSPGFHAG